MNRNAERGKATRGQLIEIATRLFTEHGYEGTSIEAVLRESGMSRGSLYHHFAGKDALFSAVLDSVQETVDGKLAEATKGVTDPVIALRAGCLEWIRLAGDPIVRRIVLLDAPAVLGWQCWRELDERHTLGTVKIALRAAAGAGRIDRSLVDVVAHILLAALNETALLIARADDPASASVAGEAAITQLLRGFLCR